MKMKLENEIASSLCEVCLNFGSEENASFLDNLSRVVRRTVKRTIDITFSLIFLIISIPVFVVIALAIRLNSKGPVFFLQERIGYMGRHFPILKFRTMLPENSDSEHRHLVEEILKQHEENPEDPELLVRYIEYIESRVTRVGQFLRTTSLDELPQLINILLGQMSLVGPRPHPVYEVENYKNWYKRRLCVKPGLTGWSKLNLRMTPKNYEEAILYDLWYVDHFSIRLDLQIILLTVPMVLTLKDAR